MARQTVMFESEGKGFTVIELYAALTKAMNDPGMRDGMVRVRTRLGADRDGALMWRLTITGEEKNNE